VPRRFARDLESANQKVFAQPFARGEAAAFQFSFGVTPDPFAFARRLAQDALAEVDRVVLGASTNGGGIVTRRSELAAGGTDLAARTFPGIVASIDEPFTPIGVPTTVTRSRSGQ